jgi:single-strand DNA-binding protein
VGGVMAEIRLPSLNRVLITGYATRDPELRYTPAGTAVANFGIGSTRRYRDQSGEWKDDTTFVNVVAWQKWAEVVRDSIRKGSPMLVEGRIQSRSWEGEDGKRRTVVEIRADRVQALEKGAREGGRPPADVAPQGEEAETPPPDLDDVPF